MGAQALIMLAAFMVLGVTNISVRPLRTFALGLLEYLSVSVLAFTVMLGLFFVTAPDLSSSEQVLARRAQEPSLQLFWLCQLTV